MKDEYIPLSTRGARTRVIFTSGVSAAGFCFSLSHHFPYKRVHVVGVVVIVGKGEGEREVGVVVVQLVVVVLSHAVSKV